MQIAAVVLAAGRSSRLGRPKQLLQVGGKSLLRRAVECAIEAGCFPVAVVLGAQAPRVRPALDGLDVDVILNPRWRDGIGGSVRAGVIAVAEHPEVRAALVLPCDQARLTSEVLRAVCARFDEDPGRMVACEYAGTVGVPALFGRGRFDELRALPTARGAREILLRHLDEVRRVPWPDGALDVDTPEDRARLLGKGGPTGADL